MGLDDPSTQDDAREAVNELQCGKSAGSDGIVPEVFKAGGHPLTKKFTEFLLHVLGGSLLPQDLKDARIVTWL